MQGTLQVARQTARLVYAAAPTTSTSKASIRPHPLLHVLAHLDGTLSLTNESHRTDTLRSDSPFALVMSSLEAIPVLSGTQDTGFAWTIYTGDLVAHDPENQLSRYTSKLLLCFRVVSLT